MRLNLTLQTSLEHSNMLLRIDHAETISPPNFAGMGNTPLEYADFDLFLPEVTTMSTGLRWADAIEELKEPWRADDERPWIEAADGDDAPAEEDDADDDDDDDDEDDDFDDDDDDDEFDDDDFDDDEFDDDDLEDLDDDDFDDEDFDDEDEDDDDDDDDEEEDDGPAEGEA